MRCGQCLRLSSRRAQSSVSRSQYRNHIWGNCGECWESDTNAYLVSGDKVPDEEEDGHDYVFGDGHDVGARNLFDVSLVKSRE